MSDINNEQQKETAQTAPAPEQPKASEAGENAQVVVNVQNASKRSGLAVASMVVGIVAVVLCLVPIVNNVALILAILGLIFGIIGIIGTGTGKKLGRGMAIAGVVLAVIAGVFTIASQAFYGAVLDEAANQLSTSTTSTTQTSAEGTDQGSESSSATAVAEDAGVTTAYPVTIDSCKKGKDYSGKPAVTITYTWTNNSDDDNSFGLAVSAEAFQDGTELETAVMKNSDSSNLMKKIKPGKSLQVTQSYKLDSETKPVSVEVAELFSFDDTLIAEKTFELK